MLKLTQRLIHVLEYHRISEVCICAGARNAPLVYALNHCPHIKAYYWFEERSAAFFALGRARATGRPLAVITTSGTAAGELLPAAMEAHYTHTPLLLITADRPRRFRGCGAPQSAEQVNLFGCYSEISLDVEGDDSVDLSDWKQERPAHINVCFEEPQLSELQNLEIHPSDPLIKTPPEKSSNFSMEDFQHFFMNCRRPIVILGAVPIADRMSVLNFLIKLNAPVYAEAQSGLREHSQIAHLRVCCIDDAWSLSEKHNYPIDGVLRIGSVPTARLWRDLEEIKPHLPVLSISHLPFTGLSRASVLKIGIKEFCEQLEDQQAYDQEHSKAWLNHDHARYQKILSLMQEEPLAELSFLHRLSNIIPYHSRIYVGNSLPIREWDFVATSENRKFEVGASRGLNGIDGQMSTFLGWSKETASNWAILGDLTTLYDMAGLWIRPQLPGILSHIVVVNNGGGKIFEKIFGSPEFYNCHGLNFSHLAAMWNLPYHHWNSVEVSFSNHVSELIEITPDNQASKRLTKKIKEYPL